MGGIGDSILVGLDILASTLDAATNVVTCMLGDAQGNSAGPTDSTNAEFWFPPGWCAIPADPTPGQPSAQAFAVRQGDVDIVLGVRDARFANQYANLRAGEFAAYATAGQARIVGKADGTVTIFTTADNTKGGKAVFFTVGPDGFKFVAPFGSFIFDSTGWRVRHQGGFNLKAGAIGGLPGPLSALGGYFNVTAPMMKFQAPLVMLGNGPAYNPCTYSLAENPLTTPGVPHTAIGFGAPTGEFASISVRISAT